MTLPPLLFLTSIFAQKRKGETVALLMTTLSPLVFWTSKVIQKQKGTQWPFLVSRFPLLFLTRLPFCVHSNPFCF